ncbi:thiamine pyrophosphate-binding protein [Sorangium sp. So ce1182]|uniref:thiamine pyrophosphate-binding protein n=1 Tax=Sorangium sp. So ce1182 TaxID=3133334 RepID=UPI003F637192
MATAMKTAVRRWSRDYIFDIMRLLGIEYMFGVPGTNEIPIIDGCDTEENKGKVTYVECLHENIALGAAMGYARMTGKPGVVEVHVTPGIGHCLGNLSNAWKSRTPLVILCGQQQNELVTQEPLLASNVVQIASQFTKWSHEVRSREEMALVLQRAFKEAMAPPAGPVFVSIPWDFLIHEIGPEDRIAGVTRVGHRFTGDRGVVRKAAELLSRATNPVIIAGDGVGYAGAWRELKRLAQLLGAPVYLEGFSSLASFPNSDYHWQGELLMDQQEVQRRLKPHDVAFLCGFGAQAQVTVFNYSSGPLIPESVRQVYLHNNAWEIGKNHYGDAAILGDIKATLPLLNRLVALRHPAGAAERNATLKASAEKRSERWRTYLKNAQNAPEIQGALVAACLGELITEMRLEERFVYVHEAVSDAAAFQMLLPLREPAQPTSYYCTQGGSLGWSMPASLGIGLALNAKEKLPRTLVVNAVGDGSSLFYPQVWWTEAHRGIAVLHIIVNNQEYRTLQVGLTQVTASYGTAPGYGWNPVTSSPEYLTLRRPELKFADVAKAFGVPDGRVVTRPDEVKDALRQGIEHVLQKGKSFVIDMRVAHVPAPLPSAASLRATPGHTPAPPSNDAYYEENHMSPEERAAPRRRIGQIVF